VEKSVEDAGSAAPGPDAARRRRGRLKPILLAAAMAFLALNVWTGSPLLAVWIGSRVQGEESQPSMGAFAVVIIALIAFSFGLYQLLKLTMRAYQEATGTTPTVRTHAPWLQSMRGERPEHAGRGATISGAERIVVVTVLVAAVAFEIWFFFLSGSSIGGGGGR
jgi:predicted secreted protein